MLGAAVRLFLVCLTLQLLVFEPFHLPFILNVIITVALVWLYTFRGGVKSLIWTDSLKTFCLVVSVVLCIYYIASDLHLGFGSMIATISENDFSRMFFFDDVNDKRYFFKQFLAGVFTMIAMTRGDAPAGLRAAAPEGDRPQQAPPPAAQDRRPAGGGGVRGVIA